MSAIRSDWPRLPRRARRGNSLEAKVEAEESTGPTEAERESQLQGYHPMIGLASRGAMSELDSRGAMSGLDRKGAMSEQDSKGAMKGSLFTSLLSEQLVGPEHPIAREGK